MSEVVESTLKRQPRTFHVYRETRIDTPEMKVNRSRLAKAATQFQRSTSANGRPWCQKKRLGGVHRRATRLALLA